MVIFLYILYFFVIHEWSYVRVCVCVGGGWGGGGGGGEWRDPGSGVLDFINPYEPC